MRQFHGLHSLKQSYSGLLQTRQLAELLMRDLTNCECSIFGCIGDDEQVLLAVLALLPDSLHYDSFDQRIDLILGGPILRNDCVPLTYRLQGTVFAVSGRCSMIARVCGVDLYLQRSYTGVVGDIARQKFSLDIKALLRM
jgi:hypothetical protein